MTRSLQITTQNPYSNLGQGTYTGFTNNVSFQPTVEELNRTAACNGQMTETSPEETGEDPEPAFGTHVREAAAAIRRALSK